MATISEPSGGGISNVTPAAVANTAGSGWNPANPAPLGLMGFGITTFVLSMINANLVGAGATPMVLGMALAFGGLGQFMAGMWEFRTGNTFGAVAFTAYGAFWISFYFLVSADAKLIAPNEVNAALGLYLWAWGIFTGVMFLCSFHAARAVSVVFILLTATFIFLGIGNAGGSSSVVHVGGYVGLATAAAAVYTAAGEILHSAWGRDVIPLGRPAPRV
ncbi:MAG TPA: acetate uptake transporter [Solirubrobacteraceae bacterium]|nr:acetate uptake transporter [Solirubrobacteraceae bacterium]